VVATRTGGFVEAVEDGKSGFLVPVESPKELGQAIIKILGDDSLARQMGEYAKYLSETRFAWEPIARKILGVYRSML
jgi:glycosyltransferase involved in cell wall biosynthesis